MIGSKLPKLKTAFYESHLRHCVLLFKGSTIQGKKLLPNGQNWLSFFLVVYIEDHSKAFKLSADFLRCENCCQMYIRLFVVFLDNINLPSAAGLLL